MQLQSVIKMSARPPELIQISKVYTNSSLVYDPHKLCTRFFTT